MWGSVSVWVQRQRLACLFLQGGCQAAMGTLRFVGAAGASSPRHRHPVLAKCEQPGLAKGLATSLGAGPRTLLPGLRWLLQLEIVAGSKAGTGAEEGGRGPSPAAALYGKCWVQCGGLSPRPERALFLQGLSPGFPGRVSMRQLFLCPASF